MPPLSALSRGGPAILDAVSRKPPTTAATAALRRLGSPFTAHPYPHHPAAPSYGEEAAAAPSLDRAQLVRAVDGALVAALVPVAARLDLLRATGGTTARIAR